MILKLRFKLLDHFYGLTAWMYWEWPDFMDPVTVKLFLFAWDRLHKFYKRHHLELDKLNVYRDDLG